MRLVLILLFTLLVIISCEPDVSNIQTPKEFVASLPQITPKKIVQFSSFDSLYFQFLGPNTVAFKNGNFVLPEWVTAKILLIDQSGKLLKTLTRKGRGPGELLVTSSTVKKPDGGLLVYDQGGKKIVIYNRNMKFVTEYLMEPYEDTSIRSVYPTKLENTYITVLGGSGWFFNEDEDQYLLLAHYNVKTDNYSHVIQYRKRLYARRLIEGHTVGAAAVPFYPDQLIEYNPDSKIYYLFWTNADKIAVVNANFDTLRTIPVNLPFQPLNEAERDSINQEYDSNQFPKMDELVPEKKTPVRNMLIDEKNQIWLQLNYRGDTEKWLIINRKGEPQMIVHLPKNSWLTHVSPHHLGVRLGATTFALFEAIE